MPDTLPFKVTHDYVSSGGIQFTGYVGDKVVVMSIPECDSGEELCEFPGNQYVHECVRKLTGTT